MTVSRFTDRAGQSPAYLDFLEPIGLARHAVDDAGKLIYGNRYSGIASCGAVLAGYGSERRSI